MRRCGLGKFNGVTLYTVHMCFRRRTDDLRKWSGVLLQWCFIYCSLLRFLFSVQEQTWKRSLRKQRQNTKKRKLRWKSITLQLPRFGFCWCCFNMGSWSSRPSSLSTKTQLNSSMMFTNLLFFLTFFPSVSTTRCGNTENDGEASRETGSASGTWCTRKSM